jgi:hypothetical protein
MPRILLLLALVGSASPDPARANVVINEVLPAPRADWSSNGIPAQVDDEWVELVNAGCAPAELSGLFLAEGAGIEAPRIGLDGRLAPGELRFVTGEHALDWQDAHGGRRGGLALADAAGDVALYRARGEAMERVDVVAWDAAPADVSFGRLPDGSGALLAFDALAQGGAGPQPTPGGPNGGLAAPKILETVQEPIAPTSAEPIRVRVVAADADGIAEASLRVRVDGGSVEVLPMERVDGTPERGTWERVVPAHAAGTRIDWTVRVSDGSLLAETNERTALVATAAGVGVVLNEILADPPPDPDGDANGDGVRGSADDEFVELLNHGPSAVDLSAWSLADSAGVRHVFPAGVVLAPGAFYVVFGGGTPTGIPSEAAVASTGTLSLNNTAEQVRLLDASGAAQDTHSYGAEANADQSLIRLPDGSGPWTRPHDAGLEWDFSPGARNEPPSGVEASSWARIKALYQN